MYNSIDELSPDRKDQVVKGEILNDMKINSEGWKLVEEHIHATVGEAKVAIMQIDTVGLSAEAVKSLVIIMQNKIALYDEIMGFIDTVIENGNVIKTTLVQDNAQRVEL